EQAQQAVADAQEIAFLRSTLYGQKLTLDQADEMIAVTEHRLQRTQKQVEQQQKLVELGVISRAEMTTSLDDVERARTEYNLAVSRVKLMREVAAMAKSEQEHMDNVPPAGVTSPTKLSRLTERYDGKGVFTTRDFQIIETAFHKRFSKP